MIAYDGHTHISCATANVSSAQSRVASKKSQTIRYSWLFYSCYKLSTQRIPRNNIASLRRDIEENEKKERERERERESSACRVSAVTNTRRTNAIARLFLPSFSFVAISIYNTQAISYYIGIQKYDPRAQKPATLAPLYSPFFSVLFHSVLSVPSR